LKGCWLLVSPLLLLLLLLLHDAGTSMLLLLLVLPLLHAVASTRIGLPPASLLRSGCSKGMQTISAYTKPREWTDPASHHCQAHQEHGQDSQPSLKPHEAHGSHKWNQQKLCKPLKTRQRRMRLNKCSNSVICSQLLFTAAVCTQV
jgi:hypothetical protein